jgi:hypothetical protein
MEISSLGRSTEQRARRLDWEVGFTGPYDSPIEEELARVLQKYIEDNAVVYKQVPVSTTHGTFRIDLLLESDSGLFAFEADGKEFHDYSRDMFRDAVILAHSEIKAVVRITGRDVNYSLEEALFVISQIHPAAFSARGLVNLKILAGRRIHLDSVYVGSDFAHAFPKEQGGPVPRVGHLSKERGDGIWKRLSSFAQLHPLLKPDELVSRGDAENLNWYRD